MSRSFRSLRSLSRLGVALWIGFALAQLEPSPAPETAAEVESRVAPLRPQPPPPTQAHAAPPEPSPVGVHEIDAGMELLAAGGRFPVLTCGYDDFGSFARYAGAMRSLGARFVVVERRRIQAEIDLERGSMRPGPPGPGFSPRARDYSGEAALSGLARQARERFGPGAEVMMLVPRELDAGLFGGIARSLRERGESPDLYRELRGAYQADGRGGVLLLLEEGIRQDGSRAGLELLFDLGQIAAVVRAEPVPEA